MRTLKVLPLTDEVQEFYFQHKSYYSGDSGVDLFMAEEVHIPGGQTKFVKLGIKAAAYDEKEENVSFLIAPRSSLSKTPLRLANSIGVIDAGYRGELMACFDNIKETGYTVKPGQRLLQALYFDGKPFTLQIVDSLSPSDRDSGGWGSTGLYHASSTSVMCVKKE